MKNRIINIFLLLAISVFITIGITACKKHKNVITINGQVYDPYISTYLSGANVTISSSKLSSGFFNSNYTDIATTTTDANGSFSFEFDQEKSAGYRFYIAKENYFDLTVDVPDADIQPENIYTTTFNLYPAAYLKLHVKNTNPHDSTDLIAYSYNIDNISCAECCSNTITKGYGKTYDVTSKCKTYGSRDVQINWHVDKWNLDVAYSDTVFCAPFDTTFFEILY
jgi:hypothetical protein